MMSVGMRPYVGDQTYNYKEELGKGDTENRTAGLEENQAFAARLYQALYPENTGAKDAGLAEETGEARQMTSERYESVYGTSAVADERDGSLLDTVAKRKRLSVDIAKLASPIRKVEEKEKYNPYWSMFWKGRV